MKDFEKRLYADLAGAKAVMDEQERLRRLLEPLEDPVALALARAIPDPTELSGIKALIDDQERMKKILAPFDEPTAGHLANATPSIMQILQEQSARELQTLHGAYAEIEAARKLTNPAGLYHLPPWDFSLEQEVKRVVAENAMLSTIAPTAWLDTMKQSVLLRQQPWLNDLEPTSSIRALTEIQLLGSAINAVNPFSDSVTEATRKLLGDWSKVSELPPEIYTDKVARRDFYLAQGYDSALSSLPDAARVESMYLSGMIDTPSVPVRAENDAADPAVFVESDGLALAAEAREKLVALERELREFIDLRMKALYGQMWTKQRVPGAISKSAKERRADDAHYNNKNLSLVEYFDFPDYSQIITRNDNWTEVFNDYFLRRESVIESFIRLAPIRNAAMHSRPLSQEDMDFLYVEVRRLQIAMRRAIPAAAETDWDNDEKPMSKSR